MAVELKLYDVLQVKETACPEVIHAAYRALQRQFHPDAGGTNELANALNHARDVLLDPVERNRYDAALKIRSGQDSTSRNPKRTDQRQESGNPERTYAVCLRCRTRNMVDYHSIERATCFTCKELLVPQMSPKSPSQAPQPESPVQDPGLDRSSRISWLPVVFMATTGMACWVAGMHHWQALPTGVAVAVGDFIIWIVVEGVRRP